MPPDNLTAMFSHNLLPFGHGPRSAAQAGGVLARRVRAALFFLLVFPVFAQEAPKPLPIDDKAPHANEWRGARDRLHQKQSELFNLINHYRGHGDFTKADLALSAKSHEPIFAAWQKVFSAYEGGKLEEARALAKEAEKVLVGINWNERLQRRVTQAQAWPDEEVVRSLENQGGKHTRNFAPQLVIAKRRASAAWGKVAEAMTPESDPQKLNELMEQAYAADAEVQLMQSLSQSKQALDSIHVDDPKITSPEMTKALEAIQAAEAEEIAVNKMRVDAARRQRQFEILRREGVKDLTKAYQEASKAYQEAVKAYQEALSKKPPE